jgi:Uma2 family endonuclease
MGLFRADLPDGDRPMNACPDTGTLTPDDLVNMKDEGRGLELVDGRLVELKRNVLSCLVSGQLFSFLAMHCRKDRIGWVFVQGIGFEWGSSKPNTVRKPDVAFIRQGELPASAWAEEFCHVVPQLIAEVISAGDEFEEVVSKVEEYLSLGVRLIWVVSLETRQVYVHRHDGTIAKVREDGELSGEDVVPGFRCRVRGIFPTPDERAALANGSAP